MGNNYKHSEIKIGMIKIISGDGDTVLDGYRLPDGDPVLVIGDKSFRFSVGSNPFEQSKIYVQAAKLVDEIIAYKNNEKTKGNDK